MKTINIYEGSASQRNVIEGGQGEREENDKQVLPQSSVTMNQYSNQEAWYDCAVPREVQTGGMSVYFHLKL